MTDILELKKHNLIYLGSPYSKFTGGLHQAFNEICQIAGKLIAEQIRVYSPIAHCHPIAHATDLDPLDHRIWVAHNHAIEMLCDALVMVCMDGWRKSYGLSMEYQDFRLRDAPIYLLKPAEWKLFEVSPARTLWFDVNGIDSKDHQTAN